MIQMNLIYKVLMQYLLKQKKLILIKRKELKNKVIKVNKKWFNNY